MGEIVMAMKEYKWHGLTIQISDDDLSNYPGAVPVKPDPAQKSDKQPSNKARKQPSNKSKEK